MSVPVARGARRAVLIVAAGLLAVSGLAVAASPASAAPPANDDFADAAPLTLGVAVTGTVVEATTEPGEFGTGPGAPDASVWYSWTATSSDFVSVELFESPGHYLRVLTGSSVDALTQVLFTDDGSEPAGFVAEAGTTYHVQVRPYSAPGGAFHLELADDPAIEGTIRQADGSPAPDVCVTARSATEERRTAATDSAGHYRVPVVAGDWALVAAACEDSTTNVAPWFSFDPALVEEPADIPFDVTVAGTDLTKNLTLQPGAIVTGRVTPPSGGAVETGYVEVVVDWEDPLPEASYRTIDLPADGRFTLVAVRPGSASFAVSGGPAGTAFVGVGPYRLTAGCTLTGLDVDFSVEPPAVSTPTEVCPGPSEACLDARDALDAKQAALATKRAVLRRLQAQLTRLQRKVENATGARKRQLVRQVRVVKREIRVQKVRVAKAVTARDAARAAVERLCD